MCSNTNYFWEVATTPPNGSTSVPGYPLYIGPVSSTSTPETSSTQTTSVTPVSAGGTTDGPSSGANVGAIVGGSIAGLVVVCITACVLYFLRLRQKHFAPDAVTEELSKALAASPQPSELATPQWSPRTVGGQTTAQVQQSPEIWEN